MAVTGSTRNRLGGASRHVGSNPTLRHSCVLLWLRVDSNASPRRAISEDKPDVLEGGSGRAWPQRAQASSPEPQAVESHLHSCCTNVCAVDIGICRDRDRMSRSGGRIPPLRSCLAHTLASSLLGAARLTFLSLYPIQLSILVAPEVAMGAVTKQANFLLPEDLLEELKRTVSPSAEPVRHRSPAEGVDAGAPGESHRREFRGMGGEGSSRPCERDRFSHPTDASIDSPCQGMMKNTVVDTDILDPFLRGAGRRRISLRCSTGRGSSVPRSRWRRSSPVSVPARRKRRGADRQSDVLDVTRNRRKGRTVQANDPESGLSAGRLPHRRDGFRPPVRPRDGEPQALPDAGHRSAGRRLRVKRPGNGRNAL